MANRKISGLGSTAIALDGTEQMEIVQSGISKVATTRLIADLARLAYAASSTTSLTIGTGSKSLTTQTSLAYQAGSPVRIADEASPTTNYMDGVVSSYSTSTGAMVVTVVSTAGSGTKSNWLISLAGGTGPSGAAATVSAGSTTTGAPGSSASVSNSGTSAAAVFDFTIPRGSGTGLDYAWDTGTTDANPGNGDIRVNNATLGSATFAYISKTDRLGNSRGTEIGAWDDSTNTAHLGTLRVFDVATKTKGFSAEVTTAFTDATTYWKIPLASITALSGGAPSAADVLDVSWHRTGNKGTDGAGTGDVVGPASATSGNVVTFSGTTGKLIADGGKALPSGSIVGTSDSQTLTNKVIEVADGSLSITGSSDATKVLKFEVDGFTTATTRTITVPDASDTMVLRAALQTLTNKTLTSPTINTPVITVADDSLSITGSSDATKILKFEVDGFTTGTTRTITVPNTSDTMVTLAATQTLTNKTIEVADGSLSITGSVDATKVVKFEVDGLTTGTTRTITVPDASDTMVLRTALQTLTNKTLTSPTLTTPDIGTPSAGTLTSCTGLPISTGVSGLGTGVATALAVNVGSAGAFVTLNGALGTPASGTLTNATGLPVSTGISGLGTGVATFLATPSSANLAAAVTGETGSGALVFATSPTLVTPVLGVATATSINKVTFTAPATSATVTIADGKTLTASNSLTLAGTDGTTMTFPGTSSAVLTTGNTATVTIGYSVTPNALTASTSFTVNPALGNYQYITNNGAFTITNPASDCAVDILSTNGATAGSITFTGFTVGSSTGSALTTTNGHRFLISVRRINSISTYSIYALQ
jgi:hypothetical protein